MTSLPAPSLHDAVSSHLHRDFVPLRIEQTVLEAMTMLRGRQLGERIVYFYVVDDDGCLLGVVPTRRLLMARLDTTVGDLMVRDVVTIDERATLHDASEMMLQHRFLALPVVDDGSRLVGVIDAGLFTGTLEDVAERQSVDDIFQLVGVRVRRALGPWRSFRERFPWLLANVAGGLMAAFVTSRYEDLLDKVLALALFVPVVLALAESVSVQSVTLTLQALRQDPPSWHDLARALWREFRVAVLLGAASGGVVGLAAFAWQQHGRVALCVAASIALAMITACLVGVALPTLLRLLRRDPRIASGPIVLAIADLTTLTFYFNIGLALMG